MPAFEAELTLAETLKSAVSSTYANIEIIVVDDGSSDRTYEIAADFAEKDLRVRVERRPNGGLSAALNSGFAAARGAYVARLDADDVWHSEKLERQVKMAQSMPELAFIYTFARYIDEKGRVIADGPAQQFPQHALCRGLCESIVGGGSSALMKRAAVDDAGGCNESFKSWEDLLLQLTISAKHRIGCVPQYLTGYRVRTPSLSRDIDTMHHTWRRVHAHLRREYPDVPGHVHSWAHGRRCVMFAEGFAWRGSYLRMAMLLFEALRHDPRWTSEYIRFRLTRKLAKRAEREGPAVLGLHFLDCAPDQPARPDPLARHPSRRRLTMLEERRARSLAALDERLARRSSPAAV